MEYPKFRRVAHKCDQEDCAMEKPVNQILGSLTKLIELHRQLLSVCAMEREALVQADLKAIQDATYSKQTVVDAIKSVESLRVKQVSALAVLLKKPAADLSLSVLVAGIQATQPKAAEQLRAAYTALTLLIERITEQNTHNRHLVERSLEHVNEMKKNVLGESTPKASTYTAQGQRQSGPGGARLISKEA
jgi:flagellar biosynthesis/type III secretory pathway chaperone